MGTRGLCTAELGVRFPSPPSVIASSGKWFADGALVGKDPAGVEHGLGDRGERCPLIPRVPAEELGSRGLGAVAALHEHALGAPAAGALAHPFLQLTDALGERAELPPARARPAQ